LPYRQITIRAQIFLETDAIGLASPVLATFELVQIVHDPDEVLVRYENGA
jgi:hypothetical protein